MSRGVCLLLALASLAGCGRMPVPAMPIMDGAQALRLHASLHRTLHVVQAEARVEQRGAEGRIRGTVLMMLALPDQVRFDVMTTFGPAAVLTSDGARFQLLDLREDRYLEGPTCPENIARLLGVALEAPDVARVLVGEAPRLEGEASIQTVRGGYVVTLANAERVQDLTFGLRAGDHGLAPTEQHLRLRKMVVRDTEGRRLLRVTYDDYRVLDGPEGGVAMPFVIRIEDFRRRAETLVRVRDLVLDPEVETDDVFTQRAPSGIPVEHATCP